jgi:peptidoglycan/xylan/chitin deacetylase (PgdA/CDA1 family)
LALRLSAGLHGTALGVLALHPAWWPGVLSAVAGNHLALAAATMWPQSTLLGPVVRRLPDPGGRAGLTFDDGPDPEVTPAILDILAASGATATFFCIAERARAHPGLVRRIAAAGHQVANHTLTHPLHFAFLAGRPLRREVVDPQSLLADLTGVLPRWFRAPMGFRGPTLDPVLARAGLDLASWTRRGYDTSNGDPATVLRRLLTGTGPGDVLLLHDGNSARMADGRPVVLSVLPLLLAGLRGRHLSGVALGAIPKRAGAIESPASAGCASR